jgi:hypothetical protein
VVDEFTHECLAIDVAGSIRSGRVIEVLSKLISVHGSPKHLRSDNVLRSEASLFVDKAHPVRDPQGSRGTHCPLEQQLPNGLPQSKDPC